VGFVAIVRMIFELTVSVCANDLIKSIYFFI